MKPTGKLIVIDGTDGSGKATQTKLLIQRMQDEGYDVEAISFPQYNTKSAGMIEEYLEGKYGQADEVDPYIASIFYAVDRYDASFKIRQWIEEGRIVIADRYVASNMGHQGSKLNSEEERKKYFIWLLGLEHKILNIPEPDINFILHVPAEISQKLSQGRKKEDWKGKTKDIHQDNLEHLKKAEQIYLEISKTYDNSKLIECAKDNEILSREEIHDLVWREVKNMLKS